jgi:peptidoglycan/xylan/chitin deacetylase (PgdA/CDA1 family)
MHTQRARTLPPILMYHSVSPSTAADPHQLRVHPRRLDAQLRALRRLGLRGVSMGELLRAHEKGEAARLVGLTFDDGYVDFLEHAVPVLESHGMTATVYVVAGRLGGHNDWDTGPRLPLMDVEQVRAVATAGQEIGSHGLTHVHLAGASSAVLKREVDESRHILEDVLQGPVDEFCYPYGSFDATAAEAVRAAGYAHGTVTKDYTAPGPFTLPRFFVGEQDTFGRLLAKLAVHRARRPRL